MPIRATLTPTINTPVLTKPTVPTPTLPGKPVQPKQLPEINPDISLGRGGATAANLIIKRTFDGLTPEAAAGKIRAALETKVAPQNEKLVTETITARVRDMQVALNNVYSAGSPNRKFLESQQPAKFRLLGTMAASQPVVYEVTKMGGKPEYFVKGWGGGFTKLDKAPGQVIMAGQLNIDPPQLKMDYVPWKNQGLAGQITTITEL